MKLHRRRRRDHWIIQQKSSSDRPSLNLFEIGLMQVNLRSCDTNVEANREENERTAHETQRDQRRDRRHPRESADFNPDDNSQLDQKEKQAETGGDHPGDFNVNIQRRQRFTIFVLDPEITLPNDTLQFGQDTHGHEECEKVYANQQTRDDRVADEEIVIGTLTFVRIQG